MRSKADVVVFAKSGVNYQIQHPAGTTELSRLLRSRLPGFVFLACLSVVAIRPYQHSLYDMDMLGYMGNAVAMSTVDPREIHAAVYQEIFTNVPNPACDHLLGRDNHILPDQINSPRDRSVDAYHFAEYLPCFAIRPLYNEVLYVLHKAGVGLVRSTILIAVVSYLGLGILVFLWLSPYIGQLYAAPFAFLLMISPPILKLARFNTPDCLSALVTLLSLYLLLEVGADLPGYILLLVSVYVRTDNAVLVLLVVAYLSLAAKRLEKSKAAVLALLAVASVGIINHFSGDYGLKMLYYRSFISVPLAPGELVAQFSIGDYLHAFRSGISGLANGYMLLYLLLGAVGLAARPPRELLELALLTLLYTAFHFLLFPSSQERFMGPVYIGLGILGATAVSSIAATSRTAKAAAA